MPAGRRIILLFDENFNFLGWWITQGRGHVQPLWDPWVTPHLCTATPSHCHLCHLHINTATFTLFFPSCSAPCHYFLLHFFISLLSWSLSSSNWPSSSLSTPRILSSVTIFIILLIFPSLSLYSYHPRLLKPPSPVHSFPDSPVNQHHSFLFSFSSPPKHRRLLTTRFNSHFPQAQ